MTIHRPARAAQRYCMTLYAGLANPDRVGAEVSPHVHFAVQPRRQRRLPRTWRAQQQTARPMAVPQPRRNGACRRRCRALGGRRPRHRVDGGRGGVRQSRDEQQHREADGERLVTA